MPMSSVFSLLFAAFAAFSGPNGKCAAFEEINGKCAVLITECTTYKAVYSYNDEWVYSKRFPPGSIMKPFSAAVFLSHKNLFLKTPTVNCSGRFNFRNSGSSLSQENAVKTDSAGNYTPCSLRNGHGITDLSNALSESCNVFFMTKAAEDPYFFFGMLNEKFLINTSAKDDPDYSKIRPYSSISRESLILSAVGEDGYLLFSPEKISRMYISLFYPGPMRKITPDGQGEIIGEIFLNPADAAIIRNAMSDAVSSGTLKNIKSPQEIEILSGKTGSPSRIDNPLKTHAWAAVFFRKNGKDYLITVFTENGHGGREAANLVSEILSEF